MKVKELIEVLESCDPEMPVVIEHYPDGASDVTETEVIRIEVNGNFREQGDDSIYGRHKKVTSNEEARLLLLQNSLKEESSKFIDAVRLNY